jgi:hypothetical protein
LLVLAIGASSALVFTNRVELLKLAVILALWAAVVAAFVSVIYRRQSDMDQAKVRDLKLVYDLQLDREISARREYELSVETQLRRELVSELRAQAADEVAGLRAELAALRANLEILFDADLSERPALETDRSGFRGYRDWAPPEGAGTTGRVTASRIDTEEADDGDFHTDESPIIDVREEPDLPDYDWAPPAGAAGSHRLPSDANHGGRRRAQEEPRPFSPPPSPPSPPPSSPPRPTPPPRPSAPEPVTRETQFPWLPGQEPAKPAEPSAPLQESERGGRPVGWQPMPAEGQFIPAGAPGSNWVSSPEPSRADNDVTEYVGRRRAPEPGEAPRGEEPTHSTHSQPAMSSPPAEPRRGRHSAPPDVGDPGRPGVPPTLPTDLPTEPAAPPPPPEPESEDTPRRRHRSADDPQTGGQSVADLLARLQATPTGGGRRRRREE